MAAQTRNAAGFLGYVPEEPFLYDKLSGREFLEFAAEMRGPGRRRQAGPHRQGIRSLRHGRFPRRPGGDLFSRHETTPGLRLGAAARSGRAGGRRADGRAGSAERAGGEGLVAVAEPPPARPSSCPPTPWRWRKRSPIGSASSTAAACTFSARCRSCGEELSSPDSALEPLFLQLTGNHDHPPDDARNPGNA